MTGLGPPEMLIAHAPHFVDDQANPCQGGGPA